MKEAKPFEADIRRGANLSPCRQYRYVLWRKWDETRPSMCWVMLNPSTADAEQDDPTIRRCLDFAWRWGCGAMYVVNLFAWRATRPRELREIPDPVGPDNDGCIVEYCRRARFIVAAWGAFGGLRGRHKEVYRLLAESAYQVLCLGYTATGHPRHPLYAPKRATLRRYVMEACEE